MSSTIEIVSPDRWVSDGKYQHGMAGDVLLHDPFSGDPLLDVEAGDAEVARRLLHNPPDVFAQDDDLGGGYAIWRSSHYMNGMEPLSVGVLLTEPGDKNGLGTLADLRENIGMFAVVGYANRRSIRREAQMKGCAPTIGAITLGGEVIADDTYMSMLFDVADGLGKPVFSFDPRTDIISGKPSGRTASGLHKVETVVRAEGVLQDPANADAAVLALDMVYANTLQWHGVGRSGEELGQIMSETNGIMPPSVLLVVPHEHGDVARKIQASSVSYVTALFARPEFAQIPESVSYPLAMQNGYIPGAAFTNAR
ncbi:MAG TPA: hypothetical protein VFM05_09150 [Candidatus Saccharimonadales bacterium]|nr:hypothetical protein [Candidatus Saccharimonadales bacterium]